MLRTRGQLLLCCCLCLACFYTSLLAHTVYPDQIWLQAIISQGCTRIAWGLPVQTSYFSLPYILNLEWRCTGSSQPNLSNQLTAWTRISIRLIWPPVSAGAEHERTFRF